MPDTETNVLLQGRRSDAVRAYFSISGLYLFIYYGLGAFYPLISQYYQSIQLTGTQIGTVSSITPIISIIAQPLWGMVCDRYQIRKPILVLTLLATAGISLLFTMVSTYAWILVLITVLSLFQCALVPISDSLGLTYAIKQKMQFGNLRLWGAVGFAVAVFFTGLGVQAWGPHVIFYFFAAALVMAVFFLRGIPDGGTQMSVNVFRGLGELIRLPRFVLFLVSSFFIFGAINANNIWFAIYYQHIGGTVAGIGLAFLLFAGSEAPFMKVSSYFVRRYGLELTILLAGTVSALRWFWYGTAPSTTMVIALFFIQGISVGFYLASAAQYVRENTPDSLQVTALAIFTSIGHGLGSMTCNLLGGVIMDYAGILATYYFFGTASILGLIPLVLICFGPYRK
ncbi:MFS transporter [Brevibacillus humidisoli]|uniref:MFS transporter n=1 Tax=Brevibacillus humidisoli TaxID=2895522 RepID=UPI001E5F0B81|nr:MFS transporter [Brevibacillus humidisoli]UFJ39771.1 MFS transporter [Brevibacillus humidisoli]